MGQLTISMAMFNSFLYSLPEDGFLRSWPWSLQVAETFPFFDQRPGPRRAGEVPLQRAALCSLHPETWILSKQALDERMMWVWKWGFKYWFNIGLILVNQLI